MVPTTDRRNKLSVPRHMRGTESYTSLTRLPRNLRRNPPVCTDASRPRLAGPG